MRYSGSKEGDNPQELDIVEGVYCLASKYSAMLYMMLLLTQAVAVILMTTLKLKAKLH